MPTTITRGILNSLENTPQADDDFYAAASTGLTEDSTGIVWFDVMVNDQGGSGKALFSLDNSVSEGDGRPVDLATQDLARTEAASTDTSLGGATIWIGADGQVGYDASTLSAAFRAELQQLNPGQYLTDQFTYAIRLGDGTISWATATVQFAGVNDAPVVSGPVSGNAVEDGSTVSLDALANASDPDAGATLSVVNVPGTLPAGVSYGTSTHLFSLDPTGAAYQHLAVGHSTTVTINYGVSDGIATTAASVSFVVAGTNDAPVAAADTNSGNEDTTITGTVAGNDSDVDDGATLSYALNAAVAGLTLGADGSYSFDAGNAAYQHLAQGDTANVVANYTVTDDHGATGTSTLTVALAGTNDAPDIQVVTTDSPSGTLAETNSGLSTGGTLTVTDVDTSDTIGSSVTAVTLSGTTGALTQAAVLGYLSVSPASALAADTGDTHNLAWTFDSGTQAFDYLAVGQSLTLNYTVQAADGHGGTDTQQVSVTINGTADGPTGIVLTGALPGATQVPNGTIGQFSAIGATGAVSYGATLAEKTLAGVVQADVDGTADISVSSLGVLSAAGGPSGVQENRIYEVNVTATDSGGSLTELFRVVTGSTAADNITLNSAVSDLAFVAGDNDTILAGGGDDTVYGQNGSDLIHGGDGNDVLWGMNQADTFYFDTALNAISNVDKLMDFNADADKLFLSTAIFTGIGSGPGTLAAADFAQVTSGGSGDVSGLAVGLAVNIVFDSSTNTLYFDADGGSLANATMFAVLTGLSGTFNNADILFGA